jgi:AbrB family looped-hinge helix DNA binding protein
MARRITSKGQVTIPLEIRKRHDFVAGSSVDFREVDGRVVVEKARADRPKRPGQAALDALLKARKHWCSPYRSTDDHLDAMRGRDRHLRRYKPTA